MIKEYLVIFLIWCISLLFMNVSFILFCFIKRENDLIDTPFNKCIIIGPVLHFFLLNTFFLSIAISIIQFLLIFKNLNSYNYLILKTLLPSICIPVGTVVTIALVDSSAYSRDDG